MSPYYKPGNWYWLVDGSTTQVWSGASRSYVPVSDPTYSAWAASGGIATRIASVDLGGVVNRLLLDRIADVEARQARPLRDIALGNTAATGNTAMTPVQRLAALEAEIGELRAGLI